MKAHWIMRGVKCVVFVIVAIIVFGYVVMMLWNSLIPELFHGPFLTYWQAVGLLILAKIFFRGGGRCGSKGWRGRWGGDWRAKFEERMASMTPEEREKFKAEWRGRCGDEC